MICFDFDYDFLLEFHKQYLTELIKSSLGFDAEFSSKH